MAVMVCIYVCLQYLHTVSSLCITTGLQVFRVQGRWRTTSYLNSKYLLFTAFVRWRDGEMITKTIWSMMNTDLRRRHFVFGLCPSAGFFPTDHSLLIPSTTRFLHFGRSTTVVGGALACSLFGNVSFLNYYIYTVSIVTIGSYIP